MADDPPHAPKPSADFPDLEFELSTTSRAKARSKVAPRPQSAPAPQPKPKATARPSDRRGRRPGGSNPVPDSPKPTAARTQTRAEPRKPRSRIEIDLAEDPHAQPLLEKRVSPTPSAHTSSAPLTEPNAQQLDAQQPSARHPNVSERGATEADATENAGDLPAPQPLRGVSPPPPPRRLMWILTAAAAAVVLLVVPIVLLMTAGEDDERIVTCKQGTLAVLAGAPSKLEITLYASASSEAVTRTADQLERTLLDYAEKSEKLDYFRVDADEPSAMTRANELGLGAFVGEGSASGVSKPTFGIIIESGSHHESLRLHPPTSTSATSTFRCRARSAA